MGATSSRTSRPFCASVDARLDEVDDEIREADERRQLDRALHVDDVGLHAAAREVLRGDARVLRRDARHALRLGPSPTARDDHAADAHLEIERPVQVRRALHEDVAPAHAEIGRAVLHVRGDVVRLEEQEAKARRGRLAHERAVVGEQRVDVGARAREQRGHRAKDASLRQGDRQRVASRLGSLHALDLRAEPAQLLLDALVAAIEVIDAAHLGLVLGDEARR